MLPAFRCYIAFCLVLLSTEASTFHQTDCGSCVTLYKLLCTIAILRMPPLLRPHPIGPWHGLMLGPIVHPAIRGAFLATTQPTSRALNVEFISVTRMVPFCVPRRCVALRNWRVRFTAILGCIVLAFVLGDRLLVDKPPSVDEVRSKVVIRGKEFFVPLDYPKDASGKLQYHKKLIEELDTKITEVVRNMCSHNPPSA